MRRRWRLEERTGWVAPLASLMYDRVQTTEVETAQRWAVAVAVWFPVAWIKSRRGALARLSQAVFAALLVAALAVRGEVTREAEAPAALPALAGGSPVGVGAAGRPVGSSLTRMCGSML